MSRLNKTEEIIELATMFQNTYYGLCIDDIKDHFECSRRSAERMKDLLFNLFPDKVEEVPSNDKKKRWRFVKGTMNYLISFTADDFANLEYLKNLSTDESRRIQIEDLTNKIMALTPQKNIKSLETDIEALLEAEGVAVKQYYKFTTDVKNLELIRNAILSFKKIRFDYKVNNEIKNVKLNPYGIIISDRYYLVGFKEQANGLRLYKIDKVSNIQISDEYFEKDETFSLKEYCNNSFGIYQEELMNIELEFDKKIADDVLNYHFHPTQKMKTLENGNIQVKFTCGGKYSVISELFKWGCDVKIKSPKKLKEYYKYNLEQVLKYID